MKAMILETVLEDMNNYKGKRENFVGSVRPYRAAKQVTQIVDIF